MNDLLVIPKCENHGVQLEYVIPRTYEQRFVGAMYCCPYCNRSRLYPSKELQKQLEDMKTNKRSGLK